VDNSAVPLSLDAHNMRDGQQQGHGGRETVQGGLELHTEVLVEESLDVGEADLAVRVQEDAEVTGESLEWRQADHP